MAIFVPFYFHATGMHTFELLTDLEAAAYDARLLATLPNSHDERIVIVDIDERTMKIEGQWPWGRDKLARFVDILFDDYRINVLGFDAIFPEPDGRSALPILDELANGALADVESFDLQIDAIRESLDFDELFAKSLADRKSVIGFSFGTDPDLAPTNKLSAPILTKDEHNSRLNLFEGQSFTASLPRLVDAAAATGFINNESLDSDGSFRRAAIVQTWQGDWYPSLALAVATLALDSTELNLVFYSGEESKRDSLDLEWLTLGERVIPVDSRGAVLVPYLNKENSFPTISATDIFTGEASAFPLEGAIVLVGTSAIGLKDMRVTPVSENFNGVEVQASIVSGILDSRIKQRPRYVQGIEATALLVLGLMATLFMMRLPLLTSTLLVILLATVAVWANLKLWNTANLVVPLAPSLALLFLTYLFNLIVGYFGETRGRRALSARFGEYIPPELVEEMGRNPAHFNMESASKEMTVMFSDIRGFTGISENLEPRELSRLMNEYLTPMTRVIHQNRGTIDKYMGDAIMAFWGAPMDDDEHALNAIRAATAMSEALRDLSHEFTVRGWPEIRVGIGINSGQMRVGDMGSEFRKAYTVMGDAVNLSARLEALTKFYGVDIAVGEGTVKAVPSYQFMELDRVRVKGKDESVSIFTPIRQINELTGKDRQELKLHKVALRAYRAQDWDLAESTFFQLQQSYPERNLYPIYLDRIAHFRSHRPDDSWDGVYTYYEK